MSARLLGLGFACDMGSPWRKLVLLKLIDACEDDGSRIYPAVSTIARAAQCSARQVQRELARFVQAGLLAVVDDGGHGPGSTRHYALDVKLLRRIEAEGWNAIAGGEEKGDPESPLAKGDSDDSERVTATTDKGDSSSHPTPPDPSLDPSIERDARASADDSKPTTVPDAELLDRLRKRAPTAPHDSVAETEVAWRALNRADRFAAERFYDAWLAAKGARKAVAGLPVYLAEKRWMLLGGQAAGDATAGRFAEAFSRLWWWVFWWFVESHAGDLGQRESWAGQQLRKYCSLATSIGVGWPIEASQRADMEARASAGLRQVSRDGPEAAAAAAVVKALGAEMPIPDKVGWIWLPAQETLERLRRDRDGHNGPGHQEAQSIGDDDREVVL